MQYPAMLRAVPTLSAAERALLAEIDRGFLARHDAKNHRPGTPIEYLRLRDQFAAFALRPPWDWEAAGDHSYDAWQQHLRAQGRSWGWRYKAQVAVKAYLDYAREAPWNERCHALTGKGIPQVCSAKNMMRHTNPRSTQKDRDIPDDGLIRFFSAVSTAIKQAARESDAVAAITHFAIFVFTLAFGTRALETAMGDLDDLTAAFTPDIRVYSPYESFYTDHGKGHDGSDYKERTIFAAYIFREYYRLIEWYIREIRPLIVRPDSPDAIFLTIDGRRFPAYRLSTIFAEYRDAAGLKRDFTYHCLRHKYARLSRQLGTGLSVVSKQLGHEYISTTLIYCKLGDAVLKARMLYQQRKQMRQGRP